MHASNLAGELSLNGRPDPSAGRRALWRCLVDGLLVAGFYATYAFIRNAHGGRVGPGQEARARSHGLAVLDLEQRLGLDQEATIQSLFLRLPDLMRASNIFYATAHFTVTAIVLLALTVAGGGRHRRWRNVLGLSTALALLCFALYPTMPPRLLPDHPALIDTLREIGGFWSFETPVIERIADPYAAMPSLHMIWAAWVACAVWSRLRRRWMKALAVAYPVTTAIVVVATANHYVLDLVAGVAVLAVAWLAVRTQIPTAVHDHGQQRPEGPRTGRSISRRHPRPASAGRRWPARRRRPTPGSRGC